MPKTLTATELRANVYRIPDEALASGEPLRVARPGRGILIQAEPRRSKRRDLSKLKRRPNVLNCTFDQLVAMTWDCVPRTTGGERRAGRRPYKRGGAS